MVERSVLVLTRGYEAQCSAWGLMGGNGAQDRCGSHYGSHSCIQATKPMVKLQVKRQNECRV